MNMILSCPVCGRQGLPENSARCPQCDADLRCFQVLESIPDDLEAHAPSKAAGMKPVIPKSLLGLLGVIVMLLVGLYVIFVYQFKQVEIRVHDQPAEFRGKLEQVTRGIEEIQRKQQRLEKQFETQSSLNQAHVGKLEAGVEQILDRMPAPEEPAETVAKPETEQAPDSAQEETPAFSLSGDKTSFDFRIYETTEDDTLWDIAGRFFKDGKYYPLLLEFNPDIKIYDIGKGMNIRIPKEIPDIQAYYEDLTERREGRLFWTYTAIPGDTLTRIARKFYGSAEQASKVTAMNPGLELKPGATVRIELQ